MATKGPLPVVLIDGHKMAGPVPLADATYDFSGWIGVYVVHLSDGTVIDVGKADDIGDRIRTHDRTECWFYSSGNEPLLVRASAYQTEEPMRSQVEALLRANHKPRCGVR